MKSAVIFDLDGTLINSLEDLAISTNIALKQNGLQEHPLEAYRYFVGNGVKKLVERAMGEAYTPELYEKVKQEFDLHYQKHCFDHTHLYPGIGSVLRWLSEQGIKTAVLSNKPHPFVLQIADQLFDGHKFSVALGNQATFPVKPDPSQAFYAIEQMNLRKEDCVFVGDSGVDMQTAKNIGIEGIGVTWGFRDETELLENGASFLAHDAEELRKVLENA